MRILSSTHQPSRAISDDERALMNHVSMWGSDGYPVSKCGSHHWTWGPWRSINGPPVVFKTKHEAVASFERYHDVLLDLNGEWAYYNATRQALREVQS